jgi:hypothetical protein
LVTHLHLTQLLLHNFTQQGLFKSTTSTTFFNNLRGNQLPAALKESFVFAQKGNSLPGEQNKIYINNNKDNGRLSVIPPLSLRKWQGEK